jgi:hypothetical protein
MQNLALSRVTVGGTALYIGSVSNLPNRYGRLVATNHD